MVVLGTNLGIQMCSITPRSAAINECVFHDEIENTDFTVAIESVTVQSYFVDLELEFTLPTQLIENRFYMMTLYGDSGEILLKEKVFCTDQPITTFSVNYGQYQTNNSPNNFIVIN
jgi:hypothetical protein